MDIRIMTFNIQHCQDSRILLQENRKVIDPARMADVISGIGADNKKDQHGTRNQYCAGNAQLDPQPLFPGLSGGTLLLPL